MLHTKTDIDTRTLAGIVGQVAQANGLYIKHKYTDKIQGKHKLRYMVWVGAVDEVGKLANEALESAGYTTRLHTTETQDNRFNMNVGARYLRGRAYLV